MKTQQTTISEVRLGYRTKIKASERKQIKCSKGVYFVLYENKKPLTSHCVLLVVLIL
jgi:hypothetical protein